MNRPDQDRNARTDAQIIFQSAVAAVQPAKCMTYARLHDVVEATKRADRILVVGGGKAGASMVIALEDLLFEQLNKLQGVVNVPNELVVPTQRVELHPSRPYGINEPTLTAADGVNKMILLLRDATASDIVIVLLSGGGSALLPAPADGIALEEKVRITRLLSGAGTTIHELNCVRKHLSCIKGGRLAEAAAKASSIWTLVISDVVGDQIDVIASGPTASDPTTFADAFEILERHHLIDSTPRAILDRLRSGMADRIPETPKQSQPNVRNLVIAKNSDALQEATSAAAALGYEVVSLGSQVTGEACQAAKAIALLIRQQRSTSKRMCLLFGGETTVTLESNSGLGGRNQELALALAGELETDLTGITMLIASTDGEDGPTDAAGAFVDQTLVQIAKKQQLNIEDYLRRHDSYHFFEPIHGLFKTRLTGTNVMDIGIVLIEPL